MRVSNLFVYKESYSNSTSQQSKVQKQLTRRGLQTFIRSTVLKGKEACVRNAKTKDAKFIAEAGVEEVPEDNGIVALLKACGKRKDLYQGSRLHADILRRGSLGKDIYVDSALVNMYAKCGALAKAQEVFDILPTRNVVTWTVLMSGYAQHGHGQEALHCFELMQCDGISPDAGAFICILKACGSVRATDKGKEIHTEIVREGLLGTHAFLGTALVDMYAKCGALTKAQEVFDELPARDAISWTALMAGYAQQGHGEEALNCFELMKREGHSADASTFVCIVKACGSIGAVEKGQEIHAAIVRERLLENNILLGTALVDMYAKCGALVKAQVVFNELPNRDAVCWNALLAGYAQLATGGFVSKSFNRMVEEGVEPDCVTFTALLNACSHAGLLDEGQMYFVTMSIQFGIKPTLEHYTCMVDLFGRAGLFNKALAIVKKMPSSDYFPVWSALLGACHQWGNIKLGRLAFQHAVRLDEKYAPAYISMSNIFAAAGMQDDAERIEVLRMKNKAS